jgi:glutathione S-transferase
MYADSTHPQADKFNQVQRGHQNFVEHWNDYLVLQVLSGIAYPKESAILGGIWIVSRVAYAMGYAHSPEKRAAGAFGYIGLLGMIGLSVKSLLQISRS